MKYTIPDTSAAPTTRRGAIIAGLAAIACGAPPVLIGLGVIRPSPGPPPPPAWVALSAGLVFVFGGIAVILEQGLFRRGPDGSLPPDAPVALQAANLLLGFVIVGLMTAIAAWVAFGSGPRHFSSTIALPFFLTRSGPSSEHAGRIAFGVGAALLAFMFVACGAAGIRQFLRRVRDRR